MADQPSPLGGGPRRRSREARRRARGFFLPISGRTYPSPVVLRLVEAPEADTLSPRERAESRAWCAPTIRRNEAGMSMRKKVNLGSALFLGAECYPYLGLDAVGKNVRNTRLSPEGVRHGPRPSPGAASQRNEPGMSMKTKVNGRSALSFGERVARQRRSSDHGHACVSGQLRGLSVFQVEDAHLGQACRS